MLVEVGSILIGMALAVVLYAAGATAWSLHRSDPRWAHSGRNGIRAATGLLGLALLFLLAAFLGDRFQVRYVAAHSSRSLPLYLKASAVWAGQEGSLLLWAFLQTLFAALVAGRPREDSQPLIPWAGLFLSLIAAFFVAMTLFLSNPFVRLPTAPADGQGLNPLLRHPGMIFHPPALYLGYVGLAVPFAFALAGLVTGRVDEWPAAAHRWTLWAWLFLGLGLLLGMRWAYDVLGWGGYWGWDPVENAGLMPWLTATALLHGTTMQGEGRGFRRWNALLALLSFLLVLFGTFTTRSGLILSVHAFARSRLGAYFLALIVVTLAGSLVLLTRRRDLLRTSYQADRLLTREGTFVLTVVLLLTLTGSVFVGSLLPTLTGGKFEAPPAWFDRVTGPQFAALVLILGVCPLLGRTAGALRKLRRHGLLPLLGAVGTTAAAAIAGFKQPVSLAGLAIAGLAGTTAIAEIARDVVAHSRRQRFGGYLVHLGVVLMAVGVIGTRLYSHETWIEPAHGEAVTAGAYTLVFEDLHQEPATDHLSTQASIAVYRRGTFLRRLRPRVDQYLYSNERVAVPALHTGLREDLTLVLLWPLADDVARIKVIVNPLAGFLWLGGLLLLGGGAVALWPAARTARTAERSARRWPTGATVGLAAGLLVLAAAGLAMWGAGGGRASGRPPLGQPAPGFTLPLLDGSTLSLADLEGQVVLLNFWAPWCAPCVEELPEIQAIWEAYAARGVVVVGIGFQEDEAAVREMAADLALTYPLGLETGERIYTAYGLTAVPETFIVDGEGKVAYVHIGPVDTVRLREELDRLLAR